MSVYKLISIIPYKSLIYLMKSILNNTISLNSISATQQIQLQNTTVNINGRGLCYVTLNILTQIFQYVNLFRI